MFDQFLAQILVFSLIAISCARIFFIEEERIDTFAMLPTMAFVIAVFTVFLFGVNFVTIFAILLSLACCATNLRSLLRLLSKLIVDHYSPAFIGFSVLEMILAIVAFAFVVVFRPIRFDEKNLENLNVAEKKVAIKGSYEKGFKRFRKIYELKTADLYVFEPIASDENENDESSENSESSENVSEKVELNVQNVILFVPGVCANVSDYESYLAMLAAKGYTVVSADFYSKDLGFFENNVLDSRFLKKSAVLFAYFFDKNKFEDLKKKHEKKYGMKFEALYELARENVSPNANFLVVLEKLSIDEKNFIFEKLDGKAKSYFSLENISEYETNGFGFPEQTNIILAKALGLSRDKTFFIPRYVANKTAEGLNY